MLRIISFGEALVDMHSKVESGGANPTFTAYAGGAPANVAVAVAKLGGRSYFSGMLGNDLFGRFLRDNLLAYGVDLECAAYTDSAKTALAFVSLDSSGERSFEFYRPPAADLLFRAKDFRDDWFAEPGLFHFCSNSLTESAIREATAAGVAKARDAGFLVSFDLNLRLNLWPRDENPTPHLWRLIGQADLIKLSTEELEFLCRDGATEGGVRDRMLAGNANLIVLTDGGKPVRYYDATGGGQVAPPTVKAVDSTAAGDGFVGGLLYGMAEQGIGKAALASWVGERNTLDSALRFACACGAKTVTRVGSFSALPTLDEVRGEAG